MASNSSHCESCSEEGKSIAAIRFCSDCDEALCKECVEYHKKCKATKSHHLIDLVSIAKSEIPNEKKFCEVHEGVSLDFYCTQHVTVCCRKCIPSTNQSCKDVLPLEVASAHIKQSSVLEDTFSEWQNIRKTLDHSRKDRNENINELEKSESAICEEVSDWKSNIIKQINTFEEKIKIDLSNFKTRNLDQLRKQNAEISALYENVKEREQELEFLKEHGSNNQLYLTLREQGKQAQIQPERVEAKLTFKRKIAKQLISTDNLNISDLDVTADDTLFLCNSQYCMGNIYVYIIKPNDIIYINTVNLPSEPYGISILTGTDKAVVTLPLQSYVQFINTKSFTLDKTIEVDKYCYGITTTGDNIVVGRSKEIIIFKQNGESIKNNVIDVP